jgi:site-specific DNA-methyltransferase (adenine-specific)
MEVMATFADGHFDLAIVDPPYGRGEDGGKNRTTVPNSANNTAGTIVKGTILPKKNWDKEPPPPEYFAELRRVSKHQIVWGVNYYPGEWRGGRIIWDKVNDGSDQSDAEIAYCSLTERVDMLRYMWRGMYQGRSTVNGTIQQGDKRLNEKKIHPTQKPVKLYDWLFSKYAKPGMRVLDTHMGSGSIAIAAHYFGAQLTACEIDADYFHAAKARIARETAQTELFSRLNSD